MGNQHHSDEDLRRARRNLVFVIIAILVAWAALTLLTGCRTIEYVEKVRTDTTYITKQQRDSIWQHDSIYVHEYQRGDTVYLERTRWLTKYRERLRVDTLYRAKTDTVYIEKTVTKENNAASWWQRLKSNIGGVVLFLAIIVILLWLWSRKT